MKIPVQDIVDAITIILQNDTATETEIQTLLAQHFADKNYDTTYYLQLFIDSLGYTFMQQLTFETAKQKLKELYASLNSDIKKTAINLSRQICPLAMDFLYEPVWIIDNSLPDDRKIIYHTTSSIAQKVYALKQELATVEATLNQNYSELETKINELLQQNQNLTADDIINMLISVDENIVEYRNLTQRKQELLSQINSLIGG